MGGDDRLNILVLHRLGDPRRWRTSMVQHELCVPTLAPGHNYIVHNAELPLPAFVRDVEFDGVILTQTFLALRRNPAWFERTLSDYAFVGESGAFKIGLPQDDYDCSAILDRWLTDWKVDVVYPAVPQHWDMLYPRYRTAGTLVQGYTGYVSGAMMDRYQSPRPRALRRLDVSYRAARLAPNFGRLGYLKAVIGDRFVAAAEGRGLSLDISTDPRATIVGSAWLDFIEDSRFVLGVNSGSSVLDPEGGINLRVYDYLVRRPNASFEEVEAACFPGVDGKYVFTSLSPRNIECALAESVQILAPGPYSGILRAGEHFIPLEPDMSNAEAVFRAMKDAAWADTIAAACKEAILSHPELRYEHHVNDLIGRIGARRRAGRRATSPAFARYLADMRGIERRHWPVRRAAKALREGLAAVGARRIKRMLVRLRDSR